MFQVEHLPCCSCQPWYEKRTSGENTSQQFCKRFYHNWLPNHEVRFCNVIVVLSVHNKYMLYLYLATIVSIAFHHNIFSLPEYNLIILYIYILDKLKLEFIRNHVVILFSLVIKCRFFICLIALRDRRSNLSVMYANLYVQQYGVIIIQSLKNKSVLVIS